MRKKSFKQGELLLVQKAFETFDSRMDLGELVIFADREKSPFGNTVYVFLTSRGVQKRLVWPADRHVWFKRAFS